jgi:hypothetical protein
VVAAAWMAGTSPAVRQRFNEQSANRPTNSQSMPHSDESVIARSEATKQSRDRSAPYAPGLLRLTLAMTAALPS